MSRIEIQKMLEKFFALIDAQDFEKLIDFFTEDATLIFPGAPPCRGKKEIMGFYDEAKQQTSESEHVITKIIIDDTNAAVVIEGKVTQKDGRTIEFPDVNIFEIKDRKVYKVQVYLDTALFAE